MGNAISRAHVATSLPPDAGWRMTSAPILLASVAHDGTPPLRRAAHRRARWNGSIRLPRLDGGFFRSGARGLRRYRVGDRARRHATGLYSARFRASGWTLDRA